MQEEEDKQAETRRKADAPRILLGALSVLQMLPYTAHHRKQYVNKNPGASDTFSEDYAVTGMQQNKKQCKGHKISNGNTD